MPSLAQLLGRFYTYAEDPQRKRFKPLTVTAAMNDIQNQYNHETGLYRLRQSLAVAAGVVDLLNLAPGTYGGRVLRLEDLSNNNARLTQTTQDELDNLIGEDWRANVDPPLLYWLMGVPLGDAAGGSGLLVYPLITQAVVASGVDVIYAAVPPALAVPADIPAFPETYHMGLVWGALMMLGADAPKNQTEQAGADWATKQYDRFVAAGKAEVERWMAG